MMPPENNSPSQDPDRRNRKPEQATDGRSLKSPSIRDYPFADKAHRWQVSEVARLGWQFYREDAFDVSKFMALRRSNPGILRIRRNKAGVLKGYLDVMPLTQEFGDALLAGTKAEADVTADDIIPPCRIRKVAGGYIYLASIVTEAATRNDREGTWTSARLGRTFFCLVWAALEQIYRISTRNPRITKVIALGYRRTGMELAPGATYLPEFGFREVGKSLEGYPIFLLDLGDKKNALDREFAMLKRLLNRAAARRKKLLVWRTSFAMLVPVTILYVYYNQNNFRARVLASIAAIVFSLFANYLFARFAQ